MNDRVEIQGKTVDEAVAEALLKMGARQDEVEVTVLEEPKNGFMGILGNRLARVLVRRKPGRGNRPDNPLGLDEGYAAHDLSGRPSGRSHQRNTTPRNQARPAKEARPEPDQRGKTKNRNQAPRGNRAAADNSGNREEEPARNGSSRQRRGRRGRPQAERTAQSGEANAAPVEPRGPETKKDKPPRNDPGLRNERKMRSGSDKAAVETKAEPKAPRQVSPEPDKVIKAGIQSTDYAQPIRGISADQIDKTLSSLTEGMLIRAGFTCRCEVQPGEYSRVKLITDDTSAGMLIGRHGAAIDAVEHLIERMAGMAAGERVKMNLDINNYRRRREEALLSRAKGIFNQVKDSGREYHFEPMSARERRVVHLEAAEIKGLKTYTVAGTQGKHVVVALEDGVAKEQPEEIDGNLDSGLSEFEEQPRD